MVFPEFCCDYICTRNMCIYNFTFYKSIDCPPNLSSSVHVHGGVDIVIFKIPFVLYILKWNKYIGRGCMTNGGSGHCVEYMTMVYAAPIKSTSPPQLRVS